MNVVSSDNLQPVSDGDEARTSQWNKEEPEKEKKNVVIIAARVSVKK